LEIKYLFKYPLSIRDIRCKDDVYTHVYTLVVEPDQTYEVLIDGEKVQSGTFEEDWSFLPPKKVRIRIPQSDQGRVGIGRL
jgi:calreticulin